MICRLCLNEANDYLQIFNENGQSEIAETIVKYFHIELNMDDSLSTRICKNCWNHLNDFHKFWLAIEQKQQSLRQQLVLVEVKCDSEIYDVELQKGNQNHVKDETLCEPLICDVSMDQFSPATQEFEAANEADLNSIQHSDNTDVDFSASVEVLPPCTKQKYTKRKTKIIKSQARMSVRSLATHSSSPTKSKSSLKKPKTISEKYISLKSISLELDAYIAANCKLSCCMCSEPLQDFNVLKKHFRSVHNTKGYIPCCNNRYNKRAQYVDHIKLHNNPDFFKCVECKKVLSSRNSYSNHMATIHPPKEQLQFQCEHCQRKFSKQYILDVHLKSHRDLKKDHMCKICNKGYRSTTELKGHQRRVHFNTLVTMCDICGKNFKNNQNLKQHKISMHQGFQLPEVQCQVCHRWLKDKRSFQTHMHKHRDEESGKQFACDTCDAVKATQRALISHKQYHHSGKTFKCTLCNKEFKSSITCQEHIATHTGKDLYTCPFCPQTFKSHANMHNHKKKSHPNKWVRKYTEPSK